MPQGLGHSLSKAFLPGQSVASPTTTSDLPTGGTPGQILALDANGDPVWINPPQGLTAGGGANGSILTRGATGAIQNWTSPANIFAGGTPDQVWVCTAPGAGAWRTISGSPLADEVNDLKADNETLRSKLAAIVNRMDTLQQALQQANARVDRVMQALQPASPSNPTRTPVSKKKE